MVLRDRPLVRWGDLRDDELAWYTYDDNGDGWDPSVVPVDSYVDVHANLCLDFYIIRKLCSLDNVALLEDASSALSLALHSQKAFMERDSAVAAKCCSVWTHVHRWKKCCSVACRLESRGD